MKTTYLVSVLIDGCPVTHLSHWYVSKAEEEAALDIAGPRPKSANEDLVRWFATFEEALELVGAIEDEQMRRVHLIPSL